MLKTTIMITTPKLFASTFFLSLLVLFISCINKPDNKLIVFIALNKSLEYSNTLIDKNTEFIDYNLYEKSVDPCSKEKAVIWYPKLKLARKLSGEAIAFIENLKNRLDDAAGINNDTEYLKGNKDELVEDFFITKANGLNLYDRLQEYKTQVLAIDQQIEYVFKNEISLMPSFEFSKKNRKRFSETFFRNIPLAAGMALLSRFQNNIRISENRISRFCNENVICMNDRFDVFAVIAAQSSSYVQPGEKIQITAGVGGFTTSSSSEIVIRNVKIPLDVSGVAIYKFKASEKPGKHYVPVQISFIDQDGNKQVVNKNIEYVVSDCTTTNKGY